MFDKIAAALSVVAVGAAGYAVFTTSKIASTLSAGGVVQQGSATAGASVDDAAIAQYLKDNPQAIIASLEAYQREQQAAQAQQQAERDIELVSANSKELLEDGFSFVAGNPDGDLTLVEFSDYNCGYCKRAHGPVKEFIEKDGNVRLIVKEYPILGPASLFAGHAALAAMKQDDGEHYAAFNDGLMTHRGSLNEEIVLKIADTAGLDIEKLQEDMKLPEIQEQVRRTYALAEKLNITGTPAFVLGDQVVRGFVPAEELMKLAAAARSS